MQEVAKRRRGVVEGEQGGSGGGGAGRGDGDDECGVGGGGGGLKKFISPRPL